MRDLTEPKSLGSIAPLGPPLKAMGKPPPMPIGPKECGPSAPLVGGGGCDVSTGLITRCTVLPSITSAKQYKGWETLAQEVPCLWRKTLYRALTQSADVMYWHVTKVPHHATIGFCSMPKCHQTPYLIDVMS